MSLRLQIDEATKRALLSGDSATVGALRNLKAVIINQEVEKNLRDTGLDDGAIQTILQKEIKKLEDSARIYSDAQRPELAEIELFEASVLKAYLPKQASLDEVEKALAKIKTDQGLSSQKDMGRLISAAKEQFGASVDGATLAKIAKQILNT